MLVLSMTWGVDSSSKSGAPSSASSDPASSSSSSSSSISSKSSPACYSPTLKSNPCELQEKDTHKVTKEIEKLDEITEHGRIVYAAFIGA